jgi:hypothetical protein
VALAEEVAHASATDRVYVRHVMRYRTDLGASLAAAGKTREARLQFEEVRARVAAFESPTLRHRLIDAEARRELGLLLRRTDRARAGEHVLEALRAVEEYYRQHLQSVEIVDDLSQFYEAAAAFDASFIEKARALWIEWPKEGYPLSTIAGG